MRFSNPYKRSAGPARRADANVDTRKESHAKAQRYDDMFTHLNKAITKRSRNAGILFSSFLCAFAPLRDIFFRPLLSLAPLRLRVHPPGWRTRRLNAFTLIEMLIVVTVMMILAVMAANMLGTSLDGRRIREAARAVNVYISSARNRAMESGRPCGITLRATSSAVMTLDQCEVLGICSVGWPPKFSNAAPTTAKIGTQPLQLPSGAVIDLGGSGVDDGTNSGNGTIFGNADVTILFSPNGSVDQISSTNINGPKAYPIFLLVGKNERVSTTTAGTTNSTLTNWQDSTCYWLTINPLTGAVGTEPVGSRTANPPTTISIGRDLAREAIGMGGK